MRLPSVPSVSGVINTRIQVADTHVPPHRRRTHHVPLTLKDYCVFLSNNHTPLLALAPSHLTHTVACTTTINQSPRHLLECLPSTETYVSCLWKGKRPRAHTAAKVVGGYANRELNSHITEHARYFVTTPSARRHPRACPPSLFGPVRPTWLRSSAAPHQPSSSAHMNGDKGKIQNQKHAVPQRWSVVSQAPWRHPIHRWRETGAKFDTSPADPFLFTMPISIVLRARENFFPSSC